MSHARLRLESLVVTVAIRYQEGLSSPVALGSPPKSNQSKTRVVDLSQVCVIFLETFFYAVGVLDELVSRACLTRIP